MSSFLERTFGVIGHKPETVCAVLGISPTIMNSSAIPVTLSSDKTYDSLCSKQPENERKLLQLFSTFSDTMQFTEKLRIRNRLHKDVLKSILENLISKRYFTRTIRLLHLPCAEALIEVCHSHPASTTATHILFSNLRSLSIEAERYLQNAHLKVIFPLCPVLENFIIPSDHLTDERCEFLSNLTHLKTLNLGYNRKITDSGLQHLAKLSSLQSLKLGHCYNITDNGLQHLTKLSSLQSLNLADCEMITDNGLQHLAKLSSLKSLDLRFCSLITDSGLQHLSNLSSLQSLNLRQCDKITDSGLEQLRTNLPLIHIER